MKENSMPDKPEVPEEILAAAKRLKRWWLGTLRKPAKMSQEEFDESIDDDIEICAFGIIEIDKLLRKL